MKFEFLILYIFIFLSCFQSVYADKVIVNNNSPAGIKGWSVYPGGTGVTCPSKNDRWIAPYKGGDDQLSTMLCTVDSVKLQIGAPINKTVEIKNLAKITRSHMRGDLGYNFNIDQNGEIQICYTAEYPTCISTKDSDKLRRAGFIYSESKS